MQVDAEEFRAKGGDLALRVERRIVQHAVGQVEDPNASTPGLQMFGDVGEPQRVHLEGGGGGNDVGDRPEENGAFPEVEHARRV
jgi:hypothetical protein